MGKLFTAAVAVAGLSFFALPAQAIHDDDPTAFVVCDKREDALTVINLHKASSEAKETFEQYREKVIPILDSGKCEFIGAHFSKLSTEAKEGLVGDTATEWQGWLLAPDNDTYSTWYVKTLKLKDSAVTLYVVVIKRAPPPTAK